MPVKNIQQESELRKLQEQLREALKQTQVFRQFIQDQGLGDKLHEYLKVYNQDTLEDIKDVK